MKDKHYKVKNWKELKKLVDNLNHYKYTLILSGFIKNIEQDDVGNIKFDTKKLIFKKVPINYLKGKNETKTNN